MQLLLESCLNKNELKLVWFAFELSLSNFRKEMLSVMKSCEFVADGNLELPIELRGILRDLALLFSPSKFVRLLYGDS